MQTNCEVNDFELYLKEQEAELQRLKEATDKKLIKSAVNSSQYSTTPLNKYNYRIKEYEITDSKYKKLRKIFQRKKYQIFFVIFSFILLTVGIFTIKSMKNKK